MARSGVAYETVKHAAINLLSQGIAPSVQKLRELLGTGSNTTLANHLKQWREEFASKEVHHLPANMPKELIASIEVLWQTAMDQAQNQLSHYKESLKLEQKKSFEEKEEIERNHTLLQAQLSGMLEKYDMLQADYQALKTEQAILIERAKEKEEAYISTQKQHESASHRHYKEKEELSLHIQKLQSRQNEAQEKFNMSIKEHQEQLSAGQKQQEQSESRWLQMIDQARQETKANQKEFKTYKENYSKEQKAIQAQLADTQQRLFGATAQNNVNTNLVLQLESEIKLLKSQNKSLQAKLLQSESRKRTKKRGKESNSSKISTN